MTTDQTQSIAADATAGTSQEAKSEILKITLAQYLDIHPDYRGIWEREDTPQWVGRRSCMSGSLGLPLGFLAIEGVHFEIIEPSHRARRRNRR